jgi:hypothetical protein
VRCRFCGIVASGIGGFLLVCMFSTDQQRKGSVAADVFGGLLFLAIGIWFAWVGSADEAEAIGNARAKQIAGGVALGLGLGAVVGAWGLALGLL